MDDTTGKLLPVVTIVTDNGGPFRSFHFEAFIELHPELAHVRTRVRTPGQNGSREGADGFHDPVTRLRHATGLPG